MIPPGPARVNIPLGLEILTSMPNLKNRMRSLEPRMTNPEIRMNRGRFIKNRRWKGSMRDEDTRKQEILRKEEIVQEPRMRNPGIHTRGQKGARLYRAEQGIRTRISGSHMHLHE